MNKQKRQELITELIKKEAFITVSELSRLTFTSQSSIRRDLAELQNKGIITRTYGGAMLSGSETIAAPFERRINKNKFEKSLIAKKASSLLEDKQTIFLDASSSSYYLIPHIAKLSSPTVFTNNMLSAIKLIENGVKTYCLGGTSENNTCVLTGSLTRNCIKSLHADIMFFSSLALSENGIIYGSNEAETRVRQLMMENSDTTVFLCDSGKLKMHSHFVVCNAEEIDYIFCDKNIDFL